MNKTERRSFDAGFSADENNGKYIEGYFATFDGTYNINSDISESINRCAFDETIRNDDVRAIINHDATLVLGRVKAGTLELRTDDHGLYGKIKINENDTDAMNLWERVKRGDVDQCSFGFEILDEESTKRSDGGVHYEIKRVKLYEVSPCTFPAYNNTSISARADAVREKRELQTFKLRQGERFKKWH